MCHWCVGSVLVWRSPGLSSSATSRVDFLHNLGKVTFPFSPLFSPLSQGVVGLNALFWLIHSFNQSINPTDVC